MKTVLEMTVQFTHNQLSELWCDLNVFKWPKLWPDEQRPTWWTNDNFSERKQGFIKPFMDYAREKVGMDDLLAEWRTRHRILPAEFATIS